MSALMTKIDAPSPIERSGFWRASQAVRGFSHWRLSSRVAPFDGSRCVLMLIVCSNVASLVMARAEGKAYEMGVRVALGAPRSRLIRQLLTESFLLVVGGGLLGCSLAFVSSRLLMRLDPGNIPRLEEASLDTTVLFFAVGLSALTGLLVRAVPISVRLTLPSRCRAELFGEQKRQGRAESLPCGTDRRASGLDCCVVNRIRLAHS